MHVAVKENAKTTATHSKNIAKPKRVKKTIGKMKTAGGTGKINKNKKTWMMPLQHTDDHGR